MLQAGEMMGRWTIDGVFTTQQTNAGAVTFFRIV